MSFSARLVGARSGAVNRLRRFPTFYRAGRHGYRAATAAARPAVRASHRATEIVAARQHATRAFRLYRQFVSKGDLCFDIGANVGDRTEVFRRLGARVVAVDPQPACVEALAQRFSGDDGVTIVASGVSDKEGTARLAIAPSHSGIASMAGHWREVRFPNIEWNEPIEVPVTTLGALIARFGTPAFCKIDVEGLEREVLAGLDRKVRALSFEFHGLFLEHARDSFSRLAQLGEFIANYSLFETMTLCLPEWTDFPTLLEGLEREAAANDDVGGDVYVRSR